MRRSLKGNLILSYLGVALLTVLVVSILIRLTSGQSLMNLVVEQQTARLKESVETYYTNNGTLTGFFEDYMVSSMEPHPLDMVPPAPPNEEREIRGLNGLVDADQLAVIPFAEYQVGDSVARDQMKHAVAVEVDGETIAWILPDTKYQFALNAEEELFLKRTNLAIVLAALAGMLAAVIIGYLLAGRLIRPIQRLTSASRELARGELPQDLPVTSQDELGQLTETFNKMSQDLFEADQKRKRLTADITHDLSTPLQIISGYIEMIEDGQISLSPQRIEVIKTEVEHLRRLVGDMTTLTQAESGGLEIQLQSIAAARLLERIYQTYQPIAGQKGVALELDISADLPQINVDEGRMVQVLKNLVENALRYTPAGGRIRLSADLSEQVNLRVSDSGDGIEPEDLPYVFDRFYRADKHRSGSSGKLGLGLAICKALVETQGGTIRAESAGRGQGTSVVVSFPAGK